MEGIEFSPLACKVGPGIPKPRAARFLIGECEERVFFFIIGVTMLLFFWPKGASSNLYHMSSMSGMMTFRASCRVDSLGNNSDASSVSEDGFHQSGVWVLASFSIIRNQGHNRPEPYEVIREGADPNLQTGKVVFLSLGMVTMD